MAKTIGIDIDFEILPLLMSGSKFFDQILRKFFKNLGVYVVV